MAASGMSTTAACRRDDLHKIAHSALADRMFGLVPRLEMRVVLGLPSWQACLSSPKARREWDRCPQCVLFGLMSSTLPGGGWVACGWGRRDDHPMFVLLAQPLASDTGGWNITTFIALAGAVISLATLVVTTWATGQRERAKWARETLAAAFFDFVDTSYTAAAVASRLYRGLRGGADEEVAAVEEAELERQHSLLLHYLTKIRLLAPTGTLEKAQALRQRHSDLAGVVDADLDEDRFRRVRREVAQAREEFIVSAKKAMSLPR